MKLLLPFAAATAFSTGIPALSQPVPDEDSASEIVVVGARLRDTGLADTAIVMERGRTTRIRIEMRADGVFRSYLNGLDSDWGRWLVREGDVCFEGRSRGNFCAIGLLGRKVGDTWQGVGRDGLEYDYKLVERR